MAPLAFFVFALSARCLGRNSTSEPSDAEYVTGWVSSSNRRGTIDILWSCIFTVFLCTWSALHLNLPAPNERFLKYALRKARWMLQTVAGPEFVVWLALGQRYEAQYSVRKFRELEASRLEACSGEGARSESKWTLRHGFYANMGGIVIQTTDFRPFPVTARQLHYLVAQNYMDFPDISMEEVWDKSKADLFTKFLACGQICWLLLQVIGRLIQHLPITTLELVTLSYVLCALATYIAWLHKPLDIEIPTLIPLNVEMKVILKDAGSVAAKPYRQNPLDFVDNQAPCWWMNVQKYLFFRVDPRARPLQRFTNDKFPNVGLGWETFYYFVISHAFTGIHLAGWNLEAYPTYIEKILWRTACLTMSGCMVAVWILEGAQEQVRAGRAERWHRRLSLVSSNSSSVRSNSELLQTRSRDEVMADPEFIPLWEVLLFVPVVLIYSVARLYLMAEVFAGLRKLPKGAFECVQWTNFLPHV
jgi:hypothetical protein